MTRLRPTLRRWPWAVGGTVAVLAAGVAIGEISGWPVLRVALQNALGSEIGVPVTLGPQTKFHLVWNPRLLADRLVVEPAVAQGEALLESNGLLVRWSWPDLWRWKRSGQLHVREISADQLDARFVRRADGSSNWPQVAAETGIPTIGLLQIRSGSVEVSDEIADTRLQIAFKGRESAAGSGDADAAYQTTAKGRYHGLPVKLSARSGAAMPLLGSETGGSAETPLVPLKVAGSVGRAQLDFEGAALALLGSPRIDGRIKLRAASLGRVGDVLGLTLPETAPFRLQGSLRHGVGVWRLRDLELTVGHSHVGGDYRFDTRVNPPLLSGQLKASRVRLADLGPAIGVEADAPARHDDNVLPAREFDIPSLGSMDADLQVSVDEVDFGTALLRPVFDLRTHLVLARSVLRLEGLQAQAAGGSLSGMSQLDGREGAAEWSADLRFNGLDVARWIAGVRKPAPEADRAKALAKASTPDKPVLAPATAYLTGELDARLKVRGSGKSTASILASLDGEAQATIRQGTVSHLLTEMLGIDFAQSLGVAVRGDDALALHCARLDLVIDKGIVVPRVAMFDNRDSTVRMTGNVNLRDESLALRATTSPKDFSLVALRAPVIVTGKLAAPRVELDPAPVVARVAASVALGLLATPAAALLPLIDVGTREVGDPCATPPPSALQRSVDHGANVIEAKRGKSPSSP